MRAADGDLVADTLYEDRTYDDNNVEFIAHAPEDVAALLAEVDRLRTQLAHAWDQGYDAGYADDDAYHKGINQPLAVNPYFRFELTDTEKAYLKGGTP